VIDTLGSSIVEVDVLVDGAVVARGAPPSPQASSPLEPTWTWNWLDTFAYPDGAHTFAVQAKDAAGNVGSSAPVTATVANACTGVTVQPGTGTLDSALNSNGPNTVFCLMPGTFTLQGTLGLQSGQTLRRAQDGAAVLDGSSSVGVALNGGSLVNNVSIIGLEFQHFFSSHAATNLNPGGAIRESYGTGWTVQANYIHDCLGTGIEVTNDGSSGLVNGSSNSLLVDNRIANMGYSGIKVSQSSTITAEANEISGSNLNGNDPLDDVGSLGKWAVADNCTLIDNYVHDNEPSGIWFDVACYQNEVAHNILANNQIDGVIYEISWDLNVHDNFLLQNGTNDPNYIQNGRCAVRISTSGGLTPGSLVVAHNIIDGDGHGLCVYQQNGRGGCTQATGPTAGAACQTQNVSVHDNWVANCLLTSADIEEDVPPKNISEILTSGNSFANDTYVLLPNANSGNGSFTYYGASHPSGQQIGFGSWQGFGEDTSGSCLLNSGGACP
jgi:hypothetical protein